MSLSLVIGWYLFCAMLIALVCMTMRGLTHSKFRDDDGDSTTEVGYEEDPYGRDLHGHEESNDYKGDPHVAIPSTVNSAR